jgi:hypothetical protein
MNNQQKLDTILSNAQQAEQLKLIFENWEVEEDRIHSRKFILLFSFCSVDRKN